MKKVFSILLVISLVLSISVCVSAAELTTFDVVAPGNLIENGDGETANKLGAPYFYGGGGISTDARSGLTSFRAGTGKKVLYQEITFETGKTYIYSYWAKYENSAADVSNNYSATFYIEAPTGVTVSDNFNYDSDKWLTHDWTQKICLITIAEDAENETVTFNTGMFVNGSETILVDDIYLGEIVLDDIGVSGATNVQIPLYGTTTSTYETAVRNQVDTTDGLENAVVTWSLDQSYTGVSIDSSTGVLTVGSTATAGTIGVVATAVPNINNSADVTETFYVTLSVNSDGNFIQNADFEDTNNHNLFSNGSATTADAKSGTYSWVGTSGAKRGTQTVTIPTGKTYIRSAYVRTQDTVESPNSTHYICFYDEGGGYAHMNGKLSGPTHEWTQILHVFTPSADLGSEINLTTGIFSNSPSFYADDVYLGYLTVGSVTVNGATDVQIPLVGTNTQTYISTVTNQFNTTSGLENATVTWSLDKTYTDVSIDSSTGVLSVGSSAVAGTVNVIANVTPNVNNLPVQTQTFAVTLSAPAGDGNFILNGDFENDNFSSYWSGSGSTYTTGGRTGNAGVYDIGTADYGLKQTLSLGKGKTYVFSFWVKLDNTGSGAERTGNSIGWYMLNGTTGVSSELSDKSQWSNEGICTLQEGEWVQFIHYFNTNNQTADVADYIFCLLGSSIRVLIDDVYLGEVKHSLAINSFSSDKGSQSLSTFDANTLNLDVTNSVLYSGYDDPLLTFGYVNQFGTTAGVTKDISSEWSKIDWTSSAETGNAFSSIIVGGHSSEEHKVAGRVRLSFSQSGGTKKYSPAETLTATVYTDETKTTVESVQTFKINIKYFDFDVTLNSDNTLTYSFKNVNHSGINNVMVITALYNGTSMEDIVITESVSELGWNAETSGTFGGGSTFTTTDTLNTGDAPSGKTMKTFIWLQGAGTAEDPKFTLKPVYDYDTQTL